MKGVEPIFSFTKYQVTDTKEEGLSDHILESRLHRPCYLGRIQLQHLGQDWNP